MVNMTRLKHIAARTLVWIALIATPFQALPAASCGCTTSTACCSEGQTTCCCSSRQTSCCSERQQSSQHACCGSTTDSPSSSCQCGSNCQCGKAKQPVPPTPPVEENSTEKVARDSIAIVCTAIVYLPQTTQRTVERAAYSECMAALDICVTLCRFTL
jgi:hypothetical protein